MSAAARFTGLLRCLPDWFEAAVGGLRSRLTPGQRWTSALAMFLASMVLFAGLPTSSKLLPHSVRPAPSGNTDTDIAVPSPVSERELLTSPPLAVDREAILVPEAAAIPSSSGETGRPPAAAPGSSPSDSRSAVPPPAVVGLVRGGETIPGRDDASIANVFFEKAGYKSEVVAIAEEPTETCRDALRKGSVVLASTTLEPDLRSCLVDGGATVIAFDSDGDVPITSSGGTVVSTRRGLIDSLVDLGRWGLSSGALDGRVGLVGGASERAAIDRIADRLRALGVDVRAVAYPDESDSATTTSELRRFAAEAVEIVLFAAPMGVQRQWAAQQAVLSPGMQSVVSDAFDAVVDESYPPSFDGALAHTSLRIPWFGRSEGETLAQASCRETWEATAGVMLSTETIPVFAWCQHVAMVGAALRSTASSGSAGFSKAIRSQTVASPLTSDLGPLPPAAYGPVADVSLVWRAACRCWQPVEGFTQR